VQATGFVEHLKLPHYVEFQAEIAMLRQMRAEVAARLSGQHRAEAAE
jgi:alpha-D-ribose 1-methylphosphonate 5-triphosphate synthase subunit PhnI